MEISTLKCLICNKGKRNDVLHWHIDPDNDDNIWCWCNKCQRGYSIWEYCSKAGLKLSEFLTGDFNFVEAKTNEVQRMEWPRGFLPMSDPRSKPGVDYVQSRGIDVTDGMFYDSWRKGIVFPLYLEQVFVGAQIRLIDPWIDEDGDERKVDTMPGTRLGLLFYGWNQDKFMTDVKGVIVVEGAFNALAVQQALQHVYGGLTKCPWKTIATSGAGMSAHQIDVLKELKDSGIKVVLAPDSDKAGLKMLKKCTTNDCITHYTFTGDDGADWNDCSVALGKTEFAKTFLAGIKSV